MGLHVGRASTSAAGPPDPPVPQQAALGFNRARIPLDPLLRSKNRGFQPWLQADEGASRGTGHRFDYSKASTFLRLAGIYDDVFNRRTIRGNRRPRR
jgi:hypothetical protein